jgi:DNA-binding MarR family transcriptional regulator
MATVMQATPGQPELAAWRAFLTAHARVSEVLERELMAARGLPLTWYDVLVQLEEAPGGRLRMHDLAAAVLLSRAGLTRLVDRMAGAGLVRRAACEEDRRGTYVELTREGREALAAAAPVHLEGIERHFTGHLTPEETAALRTALGRIADRLEPATAAS